MSGQRKIKVGDYITFKAATRWNCGKVRRKVVAIDALGRPNVRYGGWSDFIVHLHEISKVETTAIKKKGESHAG